VEPAGNASGEAATTSTDVTTATGAAATPELEEADKISSEPTIPELPVQEGSASSETKSESKPEAEKERESRSKGEAAPGKHAPLPAAAPTEAPAEQPSPMVPPSEAPIEQAATVAPHTDAPAEQAAPVAPPAEAPAGQAPPAASPAELPAGQTTPESGTAIPEAQPGQEPVALVGEDDFSIFDSQADLEEIFSAMEDVKKEEATAIATTVQAIESGQDAAAALQNVSSEVAEKIQKQLEERSEAEEEHFVTEEEFLQRAKASTSKTWYHCLYFLAFKSETGTASKKVLYEALKEPLSKSPVDVLPEHMFNFGLSTLIKVMLYEKPVVLFKRGGEFKLDVNRKKLQDLLKQVGPPLSKRPVVTKKEEKKMINDFFSNDKLF